MIGQLKLLSADRDSTAFRLEERDGTWCVIHTRSDLKALLCPDGRARAYAAMRALQRLDLDWTVRETPSRWCPDGLSRVLPAQSMELLRDLQLRVVTGGEL